ncbi:hypothetical protein BCR34DRAFT_166356 [Clohesyomyces aquaticus]|uniref:Uncharacterized protein n=1 Tax=Clohesyomyces aquaticus TaxID=1231657 RepID=A0A1Y1YHF8_9PLEO|nr:hypothetical protein BCR34DRAFT_166356 [Clohesyomyces aquaticus]
MSSFGKDLGVRVNVVGYVWHLWLWLWSCLVCIASSSCVCGARGVRKGGVQGPRTCFGRGRRAVGSNLRVCLPLRASLLYCWVSERKKKRYEVGMCIQGSLRGRIRMYRGLNCTGQGRGFDSRGCAVAWCCAMMQAAMSAVFKAVLGASLTVLEGAGVPWGGSADW